MTTHAVPSPSPSPTLYLTGVGVNVRELPQNPPLIHLTFDLTGALLIGGFWALIWAWLGFSVGRFYEAARGDLKEKNHEQRS